jgi:electron transfer flavoprotein alpha subunit
MLAVIPVRAGVLPAGAAEVVAECAGRVLLAGSAPDAAELAGIATEVHVVELGDFAPDRWSRALADLAGPLDDVVVLPASPDGRDLAPRLAHRLGRPLLAGAVAVDERHARVARGGGLELHTVQVVGPTVVTLQPGVRGAEAVAGVPAAAEDVMAAPPATGHDPALVAVLPPDVTTMDLAEADRIVGGGAGLDDAARFAQLTAVATGIGASMGATRVITDRGWVTHERQIGTTGVVVDPTVYLAFGISGAVQHTAGLGAPTHVVSVNTDPHCPMMQMADLAIVADANAVLDELAARLGGRDDG